MTVSTDGRVLWWDIRRLLEPTDELLLQNKDVGGRYGALSLSYSPSVGQTRCRPVRSLMSSSIWVLSYNVLLRCFMIACDSDFGCLSKYCQGFNRANVVDLFFMHAISLGGIYAYACDLGSM